MPNHLTSSTVLSLNANWQAIDVFCPEKAFCMMATGAAVGLDTADGRMVPTPWEKWLLLPCGENDDFALTPRGRIRIPRVIIAVNYRNLKPKKLSPTKDNLVRRQGSKCAYTGKRIDHKTSSIDHIVPRSRGGSSRWENVVAAHKDVNNRKSNRTPEEAGLKLLVRHTHTPTLMPKDLIRENFGVKFDEWLPFISN